MNYRELVAQLASHANMSDNDSAELLDRSFLFGIWEADRTGDASGLEQRRDDLLSCLDAINRCLNGEIPSTIVVTHRTVPSEVAYSVSVIVAQGIDYIFKWRKDTRLAGRPLQQLSLAIWCISVAWAAVLAGDIDSISEHLETELATKDWVL